MTAHDTMLPTVLLIDDDRAFCADVKRMLSNDFKVIAAHDGKSGLDCLSSVQPDAVLLDIDFERSGREGFDILLEIKKQYEAPPVIMLTRYDDHDTSRMAGLHQADGFSSKPFKRKEVLDLLRTRIAEARRLKKQILSDDQRARASGGLVFADPAMDRLLREILRIAPLDESVLLQGDTGTGKEVFANRIHELSGRSSRRMVTRDCTTIPRELAESELFGHEAGSFAGAAGRRKGAFEIADGSTLFLDELCELNHELQGKLLRSLQGSPFYRVGGTKLVDADVRVIAATSNISSFRVRQDLRHRFDHQLSIPPLSARRADIMPLAEYFLAEKATERKKSYEGFSQAAKLVLEKHHWPGNVRELRRVVRTAASRCGDGPINVSDLFGMSSGQSAWMHLPYHEAKECAESSFKRDYIIARLEETRGNISAAARRSKVPVQTFQRWLRDLQIDADSFRQSKPATT